MKRTLANAGKYFIQTDKKKKKHKFDHRRRLILSWVQRVLMEVNTGLNIFSVQESLHMGDGRVLQSFRPISTVMPTFQTRRRGGFFQFLKALVFFNRYFRDKEGIDSIGPKENWTPPPQKKKGFLCR